MEWGCPSLGEAERGGVSVEQGVANGVAAYYFESFNDLMPFNILKLLKWSTCVMYASPQFKNDNLGLVRWLLR